PLAARVRDGRLVDARGAPLILRGVNISGLETCPIQGWAWNSERTRYDPWGGSHPKWSAIRAWKANAVRLPLNEASWLGSTVYDHDGRPRAADPGGNYRATVIDAVNEATAAGLYVILDLHWGGPKVPVPGQAGPVPQTPFEGDGGQNPMADLDHSLGFWATIANTFRDNPAVLFDLYNEPYFWWLAPGQDEWRVWRDGGTITQYVTGTQPYQLPYAWQSAGMQAMLNAVRGTGASNVVIASGVNWAGDLSGWLAHRPADPLRQLAAGWHAYPHRKDPSVPASGTIQYAYALGIAAAGFPVIITETGEHNAPGTVGAPLMAALLPWADQHSISYFGWTWNAWKNPDNVLIRDADGTPTDGYGRQFRDHLRCAASGRADCR
ncbi:MAG: cellulase family glycosylhydrolase, partial [Gammaproteobacteria bacterium]|nr:cellulase family glycosylhydrolase [Gammaproteobacteria bacterium]